ncbi:serine/threonine-protein kinase, partial [Azospirillum sp. B4]|uniref:serine/threonine-protein kinase n=1 Tax=Azospirillum sp. B4 TaxID=95605 RepID=UPI000678E4C8
MLAQRIGKYEIGRVIGSGSYGTVVQATDRVLNRPVALKILRPGGSSASDLKRHLREARALARLQHPNIVAIFDLAEEGGQTFLAMEHIEGQTLAARLAQGPLPLDMALDMAAQLADALAAAHGQGVVHADIKPGNVILDGAGRPRLVDFGLARLSAQTAQDTLAAATEAEGLRGTVAYMAPELFMGAAPDTRTDIFAFGALVFEMLGGCRAFDAPSDGAVMQRILNGRPERLSTPGLPPALADLVAGMLSAYPAARPPTMDQVRDTLRAAGSGADRTTPAVHWRAPLAALRRLARRPGAVPPRSRRPLCAAGGLAGPAAGACARPGGRLGRTEPPGRTAQPA